MGEREEDRKRRAYLGVSEPGLDVDLKKEGGKEEGEEEVSRSRTGRWKSDRA